MNLLVFVLIKSVMQCIKVINANINNRIAFIIMVLIMIIWLLSLKSWKFPLMYKMIVKSKNKKSRIVVLEMSLYRKEKFK